MVKTGFSARWQWDDTESAEWEACVVFENTRSFKVHMAGWRFKDADMQRWCEWFAFWLESGKEDDLAKPFFAKEIDFSRNSLTSAGLSSLLHVLQRTGSSVQILKLHHNKIEDGSDLASFLTHGRGRIQELHLSHNHLVNAAAREIVLAALSAKGETGEFCYPTSTKKEQTVSLWLRMEQNFLDQESLLSAVRADLQQLGRSDAAFCCALPGCTSQACAQCSGEIPAVHAKHLNLQHLSKLAGTEAAERVETLEDQCDKVAASASAKKVWRVKTDLDADRTSDVYPRELLLALHHSLELRKSDEPAREQGLRMLAIPPSTGAGLGKAPTSASQERFCFNPSAVEFFPRPSVVDSVVDCVLAQPDGGPAVVECNLPADEVVTPTPVVTESVFSRHNFNPKAEEFVPGTLSLATNRCEAEVTKEHDSSPVSARTSAGDNEPNSSSSPEDDEDTVSGTSGTTSPPKATGYLLSWDPHELQQLIAGGGRPPPPR